MRCDSFDPTLGTMPMKLTSFGVQSFLSVDRSGWIEAIGVAALIGVSESGKSKLLIPLWKLNPAKGGEMHPTADYPRKRYGDI
jgi:ABC-type polar amino acid transport system ATPase subunit